jgi:glycogen synthase
MRVLMTADAVGGVWRYAIDLSRLLTARGIGVVLAVMGPAPDASQTAEAASIENFELRHRAYDLEWFQGVSELEIVRSSDWLKEIAKDYGADLVHLNGYAHAAAGWNIPVLVAAHSCVYSWWLSVHVSLPPNKYRRYHERVIAGLRAASAVVAPSAWMLDTLRSTYSLPLARSEVIPNFTYSRREQVGKEHFILAAGRFWDPAKNLTLLDGIATRLAWPVYVAGTLEGPEGDRETPLHVKTMGQLSRPDMAERFAKAAIFAHPARYEPFGLAVLEAAASGCALVLSDIPPLRELWGECAVFVSSGDPVQWTERLNRLAESDSYRMELAGEARRRAADFIPEATLQGYLNLYGRLTARRQNSAVQTIELHEHPHQTVLPLHRF